jgi:hypothetical protein
MAQSEDKDPYWWTPWAVLAAIVIMGILGYKGVLTHRKSGPTAADIPFVPPAPSASAPRMNPAPGQ